MHLPQLVVRVTVAVVLGVGAVPVDAAGALLDAGTRASPVEVLLVGPAHPPRVGRPIWEANSRQTQNTFFFLTKQKTLVYRRMPPQKRGEKSQTNDLQEAVAPTERQVWRRRLSRLSEAVQTPSHYK